MLAIRMEDMLVVILGYLIGSVPFAYLLARRGGVDLRYAGSGNVGATNVLRTRGIADGLAALGLDGAKGTVAVLVAQRVAEGPMMPVAAGLAAIAGHVYPVWLRFRGGKGVATTAGAFGVLAPVAVLVAGGVFVLTIAMTRYVSAGSVAAAVTLVAAAIFSEAPGAVSAAAALAALIIVFRHRGNLGRLAAGTERRIGQRT